MKYAMQSSVHVDEIKASVWTSDDGERSILSFESGVLTGTLSMHIPPAVAQATADAFNKAMREHERDKEMRRVEAAE